MAKQKKTTNRPTPPAADGSAPAAPAGDAPRKESAAFQKLKQNLSRPPGLSGLPAGLSDVRKSGPAYKGGKQVGRNQAPGGAGRTGVPRRTAGG